MYILEPKVTFDQEDLSDSTLLIQFYKNIIIVWELAGHYWKD